MLWVYVKGKQGDLILIEDTDAGLPKDRHVDGVTEWKMILVSASNNSIFGDLDYFKALEKLKPIEEKDKQILVKGLSLKELEYFDK